MTLTCNIHSLLSRLTFLKRFRFILLSHTVTLSSSAGQSLCELPKIKLVRIIKYLPQFVLRQDEQRKINPVETTTTTQQLSPKIRFINSRVDDDESQRGEKSRTSRQNSFKNRPNSDVLISNLGITANFIYKGSFIRNVKSRVLNTLARGAAFMRRDCVKNRFKSHTCWVNLIYTWVRTW